MVLFSFKKCLRLISFRELFPSTVQRDNHARDLQACWSLLQSMWRVYDNQYILVIGVTNAGCRKRPCYDWEECGPIRSLRCARSCVRKLITAAGLSLTPAWELMSCISISVRRLYLYHYWRWLSRVPSILNGVQPNRPVVFTNSRDYVCWDNIRAMLLPNVKRFNCCSILIGIKLI